ncbi:MAG: aldo/keto reductase, partial [Acetobacterium sp.]|nr:aldo/keto reductase [Acetobacterium sp.]
NQAPIKRTPVQWALRWVMNHPEVSVVLSGMTTMEQVIDNLNTANEGAANSLSTKEQALVDFARKTIMAKMKVNCTNCRYCMPCPSGVDIPGHFSLYNNAYLFDTLEKAKSLYATMFPKDAKASNCVACRKCEEHCPQNIAIIQELKNVRGALE